MELVKAYKTTDGTLHLTKRVAVEHEIMQFLQTCPIVSEDCTDDDALKLAAFVIDGFEWLRSTMLKADLMQASGGTDGKCDHSEFPGPLVPRRSLPPVIDEEPPF